MRQQNGLGELLRLQLGRVARQEKGRGFALLSSVHCYANSSCSYFLGRSGNPNPTYLPPYDSQSWQEGAAAGGA
jgi:hypothetical protein